MRHHFNAEGLMAEGESPTIARRRVRIAIREAREAAGLTQLQVAEEMEWSLSKVIRIENGDVSISINDLRSLLNLLGVKQRARVDSLVADARLARTRARPESVWWQQKAFSGLTYNPRRLFEYEADASEIRSFAILYVPGLLQTPAYGAALTGMWLDEESDTDVMDQAKIDMLVEARRKRHEAILRRLGSVTVWVVADESVFRRPIGGPAVFVEQLRQLVDMCERGLTKIRMLPYDLNVPIANNGSFDLMTVGADRTDGEVLYRENGMTDELIENRAEIKRHRRRFDQLWQAADDENDTIKFIKGRIADLEANLPDRDT